MLVLPVAGFSQPNPIGFPRHARAGDMAERETALALTDEEKLCLPRKR
jgi:hypothetical protein